MDELPSQKRARYADLGLSSYDAAVLTDEPAVAALFDGALAAGCPAKPAANWIMGDVTAICKVRDCCSGGSLLRGERCATAPLPPPFGRPLAPLRSPRRAARASANVSTRWVSRALFPLSLAGERS